MPEARGLLRFARRLTGASPAAEDLVQETLLNAWRGFGKFQRGSNVRGWVYRILINAYYGQGRKARAAAPLPIPASLSTIEKLEIAEALDSLPVEQRAVMLLAAVEGFTCRDVSEILLIPIGTVMSRLSRARQSLREKLAPERRVAAAAHKDGR